MSESKEPGQRTYEALASRRGADGYARWEDMPQESKDDWAFAESASTPEPAAADMGHDWRLEAQSLAADVQRAEAHGRISNRDRPMVAAAQRILALASASPDRYPDRPAEVGLSVHVQGLKREKDT